MEQEKNTDRNKTTIKDVQLRSEELQEVMGGFPSWIVRWGVTMLFVVVAAILIVCYFFKYPDVITTSVTLTGRQSVAHIVARTSGKISKLYVQEGEEVAVGAPLAVLENPAQTDDVLLLKSWLQQNNASLNMAHADHISKELSLGDIQSPYTAFLRVLHAYSNHVNLNYYPQKIAAIEARISEYEKYHESIRRQHLVIVQQTALSRQQFQRDSLLFSRDVISPLEYESAQRSLLQQVQALEASKGSLENMNIQMGTLRENLLDLRLQQEEKERSMNQDFQATIEQLQNMIASWEVNYLLSSPIVGRVTFVNYWNEHQFVAAGSPAFSVVPAQNADFIGIASLPLQRSGKVKEGQRVLIRLANYPDQEFGIINGVVNAISLVPSQDNYRVEIGLPQGLTTNYKIELPPAHELQGTAEIVTEELRLMERFFMPLKKILREKF